MTFQNLFIFQTKGNNTDPKTKERLVYNAVVTLQIEASFRSCSFDGWEPYSTKFMFIKPADSFPTNVGEKHFLKKDTNLNDKRW